MNIRDIDTVIPTEELIEILRRCNNPIITLEELSWKELKNEHKKNKIRNNT